MELKSIQKLIEGKPGIRIKQDSDGILLYANAWTLIVDVSKWVKLKIKTLL